MSLKVDIGALQGAAQSVNGEAKNTQGAAAAVSMVATGCAAVDGAMGKLITVWAAQVLALSEVSTGMAMNLEGSAINYENTDANAAKTYVPSQPAAPRVIRHGHPR